MTQPHLKHYAFSTVFWKWDKESKKWVYRSHAIYMRSGFSDKKAIAAATKFATLQSYRGEQLITQMLKANFFLVIFSMIFPVEVKIKGKWEQVK